MAKVEKPYVLALDGKGHLFIAGHYGTLYRRTLQKGYRPQEYATGLLNMTGLQSDGEGNLLYASTYGDLFTVNEDREVYKITGAGKPYDSGNTPAPQPGAPTVSPGGQGDLSQDGQSLTFTGVDLRLPRKGATSVAWVAVEAGKDAPTGETALTFRIGDQNGASSPIHVT
ncbi:hypothetical protein [Streptomyces sp. NPDC046939]|uniref:hypothetical protein n=1 Tax=Streptomyces sp. NPDC046939 TaxID=3155376 RepID=UPI003401C855